MSAPKGEAGEVIEGRECPLMTHSRHCFRDARECYRSGFDFHSSASF
jgi:hypothetical protein